MISTSEVVKFIDSYHNLQFCWGSNDCSTFIRDFLVKFADKKYAKLANFSWRTKSQAMRYAAKNGGVLSTIEDNVVGYSVGGLNKAKTGDIVVSSVNDWSTAGVLINGRIAYFVEDVGLRLTPINDANIKLILRVA